MEGTTDSPPPKIARIEQIEANMRKPRMAKPSATPKPLSISKSFDPVAEAEALKALQKLTKDHGMQSGDHLFDYDSTANSAVMNERPWMRNPSLFKNVKISAVALLKMVTHAVSGGSLEVMGIMRGWVDGDTMIVVDAFSLPVEGTETRVNAQADANEYLVAELSRLKEMGRIENAIGWYHSHPGYGCWLSGIDVATQKLNQTFQDPWLAVVVGRGLERQRYTKVDPIRTLSSGRVDVGAFRTYPENYIPTNQDGAQWQSIPQQKIEDFGVHCNLYYPLNVSFFHSSRDTQAVAALQQSFWVDSVAQNTSKEIEEYRCELYEDVLSKTQKAVSKMGKGSRRICTQDISLATQDAKRAAEVAMRSFNSHKAQQMIFTPGSIETENCKNPEETLVKKTPTTEEELPIGKVQPMDPESGEQAEAPSVLSVSI